MHLTIAYSKIKKRNLVLINNATYQRETLPERPIQQTLNNLEDTCMGWTNKLSVPTQLFFGTVTMDFEIISTNLFKKIYKKKRSFPKFWGRSEKGKQKSFFFFFKPNWYLCTTYAMLSTENETIDKLCTTHAIYWRWGNW